MNVTMSVSLGLYTKLDLWTANKLHYITSHKHCSCNLNGELRWRGENGDVCNRPYKGGWVTYSVCWANMLPARTS
jgi:hypothetical protein